MRNDEGSTYGELDESERHSVSVAANLDKNDAEALELLGDRSLESVVLTMLREAVEVSRGPIRPPENTYLATKMQAVAGQVA